MKLSDFFNISSRDAGFTRVSITNLTPRGPKEVMVRIVETHDIDERNMIDISGKVPEIKNYTKDVRILDGKSEEIYDPIQMKWFALYIPQTYTIQRIAKEYYFSYRQARRVKLYQKALLTPSTSNQDMHLFLDHCFALGEPKELMSR